MGVAITTISAGKGREEETRGPARITRTRISEPRRKGREAGSKRRRKITRRHDPRRGGYANRRETEKCPLKSQFHRCRNTPNTPPTPLRKRARRQVKAKTKCVMSLFRAGDFTGRDQEKGEFVRTTPGSPGAAESQDEERGAVTAFSPMMTDGGHPQGVTSLPQTSAANATLQIPGSAKLAGLQSHGQSTFQGRRTRETVRELRCPGQHVTESRGSKFPLRKKAHLPRDVWGSSALHFRKRARHIGSVLEKLIEELEIKARQRRRES